MRGLLLFQTSLGILSLLLANGCSGGGGSADRPETAPVSGTVTLGGTPVAGATVTFMPMAESQPGQPSQGNAAFAITGAQGQYQLTTFSSSDGAVPGEYKVTVTKFNPAADERNVASVESDEYVPPEEIVSGSPAAANTEPSNFLPDRYSKDTSTPLTATVKAGQENVIPLELTP